MKGATRTSFSLRGSGILALLLTLSLYQPVVLADELSPPATPCVPSRTVDAAVQSDVALGCQGVVEVTSAVCSDYLSQQLPLAISQFCGNQSEAYAYCLSLPDSSSSPLDCIGFDPSGATDTPDGEVYPSCTQAALDTYSLCGNGSESGSDYFATGDLVSLTQCLFLNLDLCTPEDREGHYSAVFDGGLTDCPIPTYTPACGVFSTAVVAAATTTTMKSTTTAAGSSGGAAATSSSAVAATTSDPAAASSSAAPSSQTTEPSSPSSTTVSTSSFITTSTPVSESSAITARTSPLSSPVAATSTNSMEFLSKSCPLGQTLVAYTTIYF